MALDPRTFRIVQEHGGAFILEDEYGEDVEPGICFGTEAIAKERQDILVKEYLDNYEPPETGDAWSGGFADNH